MRVCVYISARMHENKLNKSKESISRQRFLPYVIISSKVSMFVSASVSFVSKQCMTHLYQQ